MPSFSRNTAGGKSVAIMTAPRSRRGNTGQVASYWAGGGANNPTALEYLVVAGGGGGGGNGNSGPGGGGAGGARTNSAVTLAVDAGTSYTVTIGAGGAPFVSGSGSQFGSILASGGGLGGSGNSAGTAGGNGGGGSNATGAGTAARQVETV